MKEQKAEVDAEMAVIADSIRQALQQLQWLPQSLAAVATSSQFLPPSLREGLHDIATLAANSIQQVDTGFQQMLPYVFNVSAGAKRLEDVIADYSVRLADTRADNAHLARLAAVRLIAYALRHALHHHQHRIQAAKECPTGHIAVVCTSVFEIQEVRHCNNHVANEALGVMNPIARRLLRQYEGFEYEYDGDGGFILIFPTPHQALRWCGAVQATLQEAAWPTGLEAIPSCRRESDNEGRVLFSGLRVQMGLCTGQAHTQHNLQSGELEYSQSLINEARAVTRLALPGEILVVEEAYEEIVHKPLAKVPMGGIAWLHRKEYVILDGAAHLLRTALPTELLSRRSLYAKEGAQPSPLVCVAGKDWSPLDAPHQRAELLERQISRRESVGTGVLALKTDLVATLKQNSRFLDVTQQLLAGLGITAQVTSEDLTTVMGRATAAVRALRVRLEVLQSITGAYPRPHQRKATRRRMSADSGDVDHLNASLTEDSSPPPSSMRRRKSQPVGLDSARSVRLSVDWLARPRDLDEPKTPAGDGVERPRVGVARPPPPDALPRGSAVEALTESLSARSDAPDSPSGPPSPHALPPPRAPSLRDVLQRLQASHGAAFGSAVVARRRSSAATVTSLRRGLGVTIDPSATAPAPWSVASRPALVTIATPQETDHPQRTASQSVLPRRSPANSLVRRRLSVPSVAVASPSGAESDGLVLVAPAPVPLAPVTGSQLSRPRPGRPDLPRAAERARQTRTNSLSLPRVQLPSW